MHLRQLTVCVPLLLVSLSAPLAAEGNWPQWRGPNRDDISSDTGLLKNWPQEGPTRLWLFEDGGVGYSGPAVVGTRLYTMGGRDGEEQLICLDTSNGEEVWSFSMGPLNENDWGDGPRSTPTVDGDVVYALSANGDLACVHATDGSVVWTKTMQELGGKVPQWGYAESLLIYKEKVLCTPGGEQGTIAALDKQSGELLWQSSEVTDGAQYSSIVLMEHDGQMTGVQLLEKQLVGFSLADGTKLWSAPFPGRVAVAPTPIVRGNQVYVTAGYGAGCLMVTVDEKNNAEVTYENKTMGNHHGGVILLDDHLYGHSDRKGWTCQEFATGEKAWQDKEVFGKGAIAYADGHFYCLSEDEGEVVLIDATTEGWQEHGRFTLEPQTELRKDRGKIWVHPVITGGRLYLRDQDLIYCYDVSANRVATRPIVSP